MNKYFKYRLLQLAKQNKKGYPFAACLYYKNLDKNHVFWAVNEVISRKDPSAHAEIQAIRMACKHLKRIDLSNAVLYTSGEPCGMCLLACAWANIKKIYYINSYKVARKQHYDYDNSAHKLNKFLKLKRKIIQI